MLIAEPLPMVLVDAPVPEVPLDIVALDVVLVLGWPVLVRV